MRWLLWSSVVLVFACGSCGGSKPNNPDAATVPPDAPGVDPDDGAQSGTRLKLTWFVFADGTRQWDGFYDAQRKEHCSIYDNWGDDKAYCVPDSTGTVVYTDAACTQKVAQVYGDPACAALQNSYVVEYDAGTCTSKPSHLYARGAQVTVGGYYQQTSDGGCAGPYTDSAFGYYQLGAEVPTSDLVELTLGPPSTTGRIGERFYESADGMRFPWVLHDATLGTDCSPYTAQGATAATCAPNASYTSYYHDAACSQPEVDVNPSCPTPEYAEVSSQQQCPIDPPTYYTLGAQLANNQLYYQNGASCASTIGGDSDAYFSTGQALDLAQLSRAPDAKAARRLQLIHYTTPDGLRSRDYTLYDSQKGAECYPTTLPDGTIRCIVFGPYIQTLFQDAACTIPIDLVSIYDGPQGCAPPVVPKFAQKYLPPEPGSCAYGAEIHPISTPYAGPVYVNYGTCEPYTPYESTLYSIGPAVPLTDFVTATMSVDP